MYISFYKKQLLMVKKLWFVIPQPWNCPTGFHFQNSELSDFNPIQQDFQSLARQYQIYNNDKIINTYFKVRALKNFSENDK